jgi:hypothetical protein
MVWGDAWDQTTDRSQRWKLLSCGTRRCVGDQLWTFRKVLSRTLSTLKVETARPSETSVNYQTTRRHVPEEWFHPLWCVQLIALLQTSHGVCVGSIWGLKMQNNAGGSQNCEQTTIRFVISVRLSSLKFLKLPEDESGLSKRVGVNRNFWDFLRMTQGCRNM